MSEQYVYGLHPVLSALQQNTVAHLWLQESRQDHQIQEIIKLAKQNQVTMETAPRRELDQLTSANHQGVIAEVRIKKNYQEEDLAELCQNAKQQPPLLLILDEVQDPHNLGACLRSAECAGAAAVIIPKNRSVGLNATVRKVACGAADCVPLITVTNLARTLGELKQQGFWLYGLAGEADATLYETDLTGSIALVLGAEGKGLRRLTRERCDQILSIPMLGTVNSLNVSVASGISLFEARRQIK